MIQSRMQYKKVPQENQSNTVKNEVVHSMRIFDVVLGMDVHKRKQQRVCRLLQWTQARVKSGEYDFSYS
jgi:hypothetical protein